MIKNKYKKFLSALLVFVSLFSSITSKAQDSPKKDKSYFKFSLSYLSNSVYYGRKDTFAIPYITPSIMYKDKSGFYFEGSLSYLATAGEGQINAGTLAAGYEFSSKNKKLSGDVYAAKYFTSSANTAANSQVKGAVATSVYYDLNVVTVDAGADLFFSQKPDIDFTTGLSHEFDFGKNYSWSVAPEALVNFGTENFYEDYFSNKRYSVKRKRRIVNVTQPNVIVIKNNFSVLDYEVSLPLRYDTKKLGLWITPNYSMPINPIKYSINRGATYRTEVLSNTFYLEAGIYIKF